MFYNTYYPNGGLFKGKNGKPTREELKQIISSNYTGTKIHEKDNKPDLVEMFKKLYEDSTPQTNSKQSSPKLQQSPSPSYWKVGKTGYWKIGETGTFTSPKPPQSSPKSSPLR